MRFHISPPSLIHPLPSSSNRPSPFLPPTDQTQDGEKGGLAGLGTVKLALMFAGWYLANIFFNM